MVNRWISKALARVLLRMGATRFGPAPAETEAALRAITKPDRLERMIERLFDATATGWDALPATT